MMGIDFPTQLFHHWTNGKVQATFSELYKLLKGKIECTLFDKVQKVRHKFHSLKVKTVECQYPSGQQCLQQMTIH